MRFDEELDQYAHKYKGLVFVWDDEPEDDYKDTVKMLAANYLSHLDQIVEFMLPDIQSFYGDDVTSEDVKAKIGAPYIDYDNGMVTYYDQSFDECHLFEFEFGDDAFEELDNFAIVG